MDLPIELISQLPLRIYLVDENHAATSLDGHELNSPGAVHGSDCKLCPVPQQDCPVRQCLKDGRRRSLRLPAHLCGGTRSMDVDLIPLQGSYAGKLLVLERDVTENDQELSRSDNYLERQLRQLDILNQVLAALQQSRDLDRILRIILAGLTFGKGLEFNRAFYFERQGEEIKGYLAVGPLNGEEASHIWTRHDLATLSLGELFEQLDEGEDDRPIQRHVETIHFHLAAAAPQLRQALDRSGCTCLHMPERHEPGSVCLLEMTGSQESWLAPVRVPAGAGRPVEECRGFLLVDNAITNRPPSSEHLDALVSCARHLGFALERARMNRDLDQRLQELKTAYDQLDRRQEQLLQSEKMAAVGRVTGNLAHEIKTPLMSIGGFARLLVKELADLEKPREHAQLVLKESRRIERILETLMDYSTPQILRRDRIELGERARGLLERQEESFRERGIEISLEFDGGPFWVYGDALRLDQLLHTQLRNVLDLNEVRRENGLAASTGPAANGGSGNGRRCTKLAVRLWREGDEAVCLSVSDDGPGVPSSLVETLFEPFVSGRDGALGLGLAQARDIARLHDGDIRHVQPGRLGGAEFITCLQGRHHGQDSDRR